MQIYQNAHKACKDAYSDIRAGLATSRFPLSDEARRTRAVEFQAQNPVFIFLWRGM